MISYMHYIRAWKFKPNLILLAVVIVLISSVFGLLAVDITGLIDLGIFGLA